MKKSFSRILMSCAMVVAVGGVAVAGNDLWVTQAMAARDNQTSPVISADKISVQKNTNPVIGAETKNETQSKGDYQIVNKPDGQVIVRNLPNGDFKVISDNTKPTFIAGTPGKNDITKEKAIEIAKNAIVEKFSLSDKTLSRFTVTANFNIVNPKLNKEDMKYTTRFKYADLDIVNSKQPTWQVTYDPTNQSDYSEIGHYTVIINSSSGEVVKLSSAADGLG